VEKNQQEENNKLAWSSDKACDYTDAIQNALLEHEAGRLKFEQLKSCIHKAASSAGMLSKKKSQRDKPWFDKICRVEREKLIKLRKAGNTNKWGAACCNEYLTQLKLYRNTYKRKKLDYYVKLNDMLNNVRDSKQFWQVVKIYNRAEMVTHSIDEQKWKDFYKREQGAREFSLNVFTDVRDNTLDADFQTNEISIYLKKLSNKKAPGPDGITNEFLKNLPQEGIKALCDVFNEILDSEIPPPEWSNSITVMIHKKGEESDPGNYRPIALLNTSLKLFTGLLTNRLVTWAERNKVLPEAQAGFRKKRGCDDQIFTLQATLQAGTTRGKVYALFIDFARAFNSVQHKKLWEKLFSIGVSGKYIRILKRIYDSATTQIRLKEGYTGQIAITEGIMQGDSISPLAFCLFISDIEKILIDENIPGIKMGGEEIHLLAFADDLCLLAPGINTLQRKINMLSDYFRKLGLNVNLNKTKAMEFRRLQRKTCPPVFYERQKIDYVEKYTYLGVEFHSNIKFGETAKGFKMKGKASAGICLNILRKARAKNLEPKKKLYTSIICPVSLYCAHIWSLMHIYELEKISNYYYKRALGVGIDTANAVIKLETSEFTIMTFIIKMLIKYVIKLMNMEDSRYPKICYKQLYRNSRNSNEDSKYNWCSQVKCIFDKLGFADIWLAQDPEILAVMSGSIVQRINDISRQELYAIMAKSSSCNYYIKLKPTDNVPMYLTMNLPWNQSRVIAQLRIGKGNFRIGEIFHRLKRNERCKYCNLDEHDNLFHFLFTCKRHKRQRNLYLRNYVDKLNGNPEMILCTFINLINTEQIVNEVFQFVYACITERYWEDFEIAELGLEP